MNALLDSPVVVAMLPWALLVVGGLLLWWGGDKLVEHSAYLARTFRIPKHVIGAVVLGFGTSLPELLVCLTALFTGEDGVAIGNVVGSNIANVGFVLGIAAVISPIVVEPKIKRLDLPAALLAGIGLTALLFPGGGVIGRGVGVTLLAVFAVYLTVSLWAARAQRKRTPREEVPERSVARDVFWVFVGLLLVAGGATAFVEGATGAASQLGVPSEVIALTAVAFGTSVPELVTTVQSARQGHPELAVGNVAGSNVFNLMLVLGISSVAKPIEASAAMGTDVLIMTGFALLAFPIFGRFVRIPRWQGWMMVGLCATYWIWVFASGRPVG